MVRTVRKIVYYCRLEAEQNYRNQEPHGDRNLAPNAIELHRHLFCQNRQHKKTDHSFNHDRDAVENSIFFHCLSALRDAKCSWMIIGSYVERTSRQYGDIMMFYSIGLSNRTYTLLKTGNGDLSK